MKLQILTLFSRLKKLIKKKYTPEDYVSTLFLMKKSMEYGLREHVGKDKILNCGVVEVEPSTSSN